MGILVTNGMLKTYVDCEMKFDYRWRRQLAPNRPATPLKRGSWLHDLLEAKYTTGSWKRKLKQLKKEYDHMFDEEKEMYGDLPSICRHIMESYDYTWREEDSGLTVIAAEKVIQVPWPHGHTFQGKFDLIVEDEYGRWLVEHKSHKTIPDADYRFMDIQTARYWFAIQKLGTYGDLTGILWNYIRTKPPTVPTLIKNGSRLGRIDKMDTDLLTLVSAIKRYDLNPLDYRDKIQRLRRHNNFFRRVRVPINQDVMERIVREGVVTADRIERGEPPVRNIGRHCSWGCSYQEICMVELYGGNTKQIIKARYHKEDPLKYYDERASEEA